MRGVPVTWRALWRSAVLALWALSLVACRTDVRNFWDLP